MKGAWELKNPKKKRLFDKTTFPKYQMKVPIQKNYSDCGVFLLHYVEKFCLLEEFHNINQIDGDWFDLSEIVEKREEIQKIILNLANDMQNNDQYEKKKLKRID